MEKVKLTERERLIEVVEARLTHLVEVDTDVTPRIVASLIADDILGSQWKTERDTTMLTRGRDAGYEKGLRDSIATIGMIERVWCDLMKDPDETRLIDYQAAQHAVASLSKHGMAEVFKEGE
jgi:hypothetical protein